MTAQRENVQKERGAELERDISTFMAGREYGGGDSLPTLDHLLDDAAFHLALLERYLAAERA